jgi:endonuclease III related protein
MPAAKPKRKIGPEAMVRAMYRKLTRAWGPQHWWPAQTAFEVIAGAILGQNTTWTNVERALASLRAANALSSPAIRDLPIAELEQLVRSSGYYRQKAARLKSFVAFLDEKYRGSLEQMFAAPTARLREELLSLKGIGHETADAILLYAGNHEIFVVDAYARRILERHAAIEPSAGYEAVRALVEAALQAQAPSTQLSRRSLPSKLLIHEPSMMSTAQRTPTAQVYNEMHGLFVQVGKLYCRKQEMRCEQCPLRDLLPDSANSSFKI